MVTFMMWVEKECSVKISVVHDTFNVLRTAEEQKRQIIAIIKFYQRKDGDIIFAMFCHLNCKAKKNISERKHKKLSNTLEIRWIIEFE